MNSPQIPATVLQFIAERIDTVPQLEALLLLWESSQRAWTEEELAGRIYVSGQVAAQTLQALQRQNLVIAESQESPRYRYDPQWDPTGQVMPEVVPVRRSSERGQPADLHDPAVLVPADPRRDRQ